MSYVADLTEMDDGALAVGWLHPNHPYTQGEVPPGFLGRLKEFLNRAGDSIDTLNWGATGGYYTCEFCEKVWGTGIFGVLNEGRCFCAPQMIAHYVEHHGYRPPAGFIAAVLAGPLPGTTEYQSAAASFREAQRGHSRF